MEGSMRPAWHERPTPASVVGVMKLARAAQLRVSPATRLSVQVIASVEAAEAAALRYVSDQAPGITRLGKAPRFRYRTPDGRPVGDLSTRRRIRALAIPSAWTHVWICPTADGHIQAVGRDARGRKQYCYHPRWRQSRDATKYARLLRFARRLPRIRRHVSHDLARPGLPREKVLASVARLLETSLIRVGNAEYAVQNGSFGLTTLRSRHVRVAGGSLRFEFRGKGGKHHVVDVADRRLARVVRQCQELPGHELFQYVDDLGERRTIGSGDVNAYLRAIAGEDFTAKDFRTWAGTVLAARALRTDGFRSASEAKRKVTNAIRRVAARLGNTAAVCRRCYVHPAVIDAYLAGRLDDATAAHGAVPGLSVDERAILPLLKTPPRRKGRGLGGPPPAAAPSRFWARRDRMVRRRSVRDDGTGS
jgi:DNA topoisomerase I